MLVIPTMSQREGGVPRSLQEGVAVGSGGAWRALAVTLSQA